ncbi:hypothetical protein R1sor_025575 [Riccia sorocarpa]|uniref:Uncharacterized protein n=1 Tax=Riccia sorocarpa TaxID=122646 RepID=A0ABD3GAK2_9MARC
MTSGNSRWRTILMGLEDTWETESTLLQYHFGPTGCTTLVLLAVAHVDPTYAHLRPDWHMFVSSEIRKSLNHEKTDKKSASKFREGWAAIIELVRNEFMAKQAADGKEPLYLEAKNAFSDTKAKWDNEKCELVRQREELKEELAKAQEPKAQAERREETIRLEKEALES